MEKVVYILGAGFSRPLGLPLVSDFRFKSEAMYAENPERYPHFKEVFDTIKSMVIGGYYYDTNIFNIEDILSTLEMRDFLGEKRTKAKFIKYIIDVVEGLTPEIRTMDDLQMMNWHQFIFGSSAEWTPFGKFVCSLLNRRFQSNREAAPPGRSTNISCTRDPAASTCYGVVTLNYDRILEKVCDHLRASTFPGCVQDMKFETLPTHVTALSDPHSPPLAKLHGCTGTREIIPPTWNKGGNRGVVKAWKLAYKMLTEATQIRVIGYSLPLADSYLKYLLKAAVIKSQAVKKIDVVCWDPDGTVRGRFDEFVAFGRYGYYRFVSAKTEYYLNGIELDRSDRGFVYLRNLEDQHREFMLNPPIGG